VARPGGMDILTNPDESGMNYLGEPRLCPGRAPLDTLSQHRLIHRAGYMVGVGRRLDTDEGIFYQITPPGLDWLGLGP
jgi:hypothetical protein